LSPALTRAAWPTLEWHTQVYVDPNGKRGRIIPLVIEKFDDQTLEPLDIPLPLRLLRQLDFSKPERFLSQYQLLLGRIRGERPSRGDPSSAGVSGFALGTGPEAADQVDELLLGNLFPTELPSVIYGDATTATAHKDVRAVLKGKFRTPYLLHGERLYSFHKPTDNDNPFRALLTGTARTEERISDWLKDTDKARLVVWIANDALREHCFHLRLHSPHGERSQYFPPTFDGTPRVFSWGSGRTISLAKVTEGEKKLGVHRSARMRFIEIGGKLFLLIEPGWFFTTDGSTPLEGRQVGIFSVKWGGREGNDTVLRYTLMWARILAATLPEIQLPTGGNPIKIAPRPVHGRSNLGLSSDVINLDRLLSGDGAGEVLDADELDLVAAAKEQGEIDEEDTEDDFEPEEDFEPDDDELASALDSEPELPF
jgi:hypothetical protein